MNTATNPFQITERNYGDLAIIKRVIEARVGDQVIAGAWKQPLSSDWSVNIVDDVIEGLGLPRDYLHNARMDVRDENEARRVLQVIALFHAAAVAE